MKDRPEIKGFLWFSIIAIAILVFSSVPFWIGNSLETDELLFRGTYFDTADYAVHISMMRAGRMGDWSYQLRFTDEEHQPAFVRMFYVILGHVSKWVDLDVESTFHIARWVLGFIALFSIHQLCQRVLPNKTLAWAAYMLSVMGAGIGWLQLMLGAPLKPISPIDFWLIDAYIFFSISLFPSFSFTLILMTTALSLYLGYLKTGKWKLVILVSLFATISQLTNPIAFAVIDIAIVCATTFNWWKDNNIKLQQIYALGIIALAQTPLLLYNFLVLSREPIWSQFTLQNQTLSPPPLFYVWGFAPFWPFAIWGMVISFRERNPAISAMSAWAVCGFALAYLPVLIQRRFLLGMTIPLGILAIYGLKDMLAKFSTRLRGLQQRENLLYFTYILLASISSIYLVLGSSLYIQSRPTDRFYPREIESALIWLDNNAMPNDFVLSNKQTGELIAQYTNLKVFVGHEMETLYFNKKTHEVSMFYNGNMDSTWLEASSIDWVFFGPYEKSLILKNPFSFDEGIILYVSDNLLIYKIDK